jgi:hypothetical protein
MFSTTAEIKKPTAMSWFLKLAEAVSAKIYSNIV